MTKRLVDVVVISDVHLGTYGSQATALYNYLKSIDVKTLVLNGDIIDIWQFRKRYWPVSHMKVVQRIIKMMSNGTQVYYLTGNHDEMLRKFVPFALGNFELANKLVLNLDGKSAWIFHGDVFDITMRYSKWMAKLGGIGYDLLILINSFVNYLLKLFGKGKISFSKRIKNSVKSAVKFIDDFEKTATEIAIKNGYDYVICGHIHQPLIKHISHADGETTYLNSGDWVENLTSLEYDNGNWVLYKHALDEESDANEDQAITELPSITDLLKSITN